jgi:hypothetical protein
MGKHLIDEPSGKTPVCQRCFHRKLHDTIVNQHSPIYFALYRLIESKAHAFASSIKVHSFMEDIEVSMFIDELKEQASICLREKKAVEKTYEHEEFSITFFVRMHEDGSYRGMMCVPVDSD